MNKKRLYVVLFCLIIIKAYAQVGVNNTNPNALLDVRASNQANPTNTDGILIPKIDDFPSTDPGAAQDGMLVYASGLGVPAKGFYYWNSATDTWETFGGGSGNTLNDAYNGGGAGAGRIITANDGAVTISGEDGFLVTGAFGSGDAITVSGAGTRMFFNPRKAAFRAGYVSLDYWDDAQVGDYSFAAGHTSAASGLASTSIGTANIASGPYSVAFGRNNLSSEYASTVFGENNQALGSLTFVAGSNSHAIGEGAVAIGQVTRAEGDNTIVIGNGVISEGIRNVAIGNGLRTFSADEMAFGKFNTTYTPANNDTDRLLIIGNGVSNASRSDVLILLKNGNMGIGRNPSTNTLEVEGQASKSTAGDWIANSDERLKKNIKTLDAQEALNKILNLRGVTYEWNDDKTGTKRPDGIQYGFIAQEIATVFPENVTEDHLGYLQTPYGTYDALYVQAIKELNSKIISLEEENSKLREKLAKIEEIEKRLLNLEQKENGTWSAFKP